MTATGYRWTIRQEGESWCWRAERQADGSPLAAGQASSRAQAAAQLARVIAFGVVADQATA